MTVLCEFREWTPSTCRLAPAVVAYLLAEHRRSLRIEPTATPGEYRVIPRNRVGTLATPAGLMRIHPKIKIAHVAYFLAPDTPFPLERAPASTQADALFDFLALHLATHLRARTAAGLHRELREQASCGPALQGRLDVAAQLREAAFRKDQLHSVSENWTSDLLCNQLPKSVAERVLSSLSLGPITRQALAGALHGFAGVQSIPVRAESFGAHVRDCAPAEYQPLLELCQLLADGLAAGKGKEAGFGPAFLLDMEQVFERYVARELRIRLNGVGQLAPLTVAVQPQFRAAMPSAGGPELAIRPDLLLTRNGKPLLVLDTKWKRLRPSRLSPADVYQVLAYAAVLGVPHAWLVYPGSRTRCWECRLRNAPTQLTICTLRVRGSREQLAHALDRLARRIARLR